MVVTACDGLDGTKDGLIADPFACSRQPRSIECAPGQTSTAASFCLTAEQVSTVTKLYRGPADSHGRLLYPGWHGLADPAISPVGTIAYYQAVQNFMGGAARTSDFARLFMLPGVGHCGGGDGPDSFNGLGALVDWVEQGQAPTSLLTSKVRLSRRPPRRVAPMPRVVRCEVSWRVPVRISSSRPGSVVVAVPGLPGREPSGPPR